MICLFKHMYLLFSSLSLDKTHQTELNNLKQKVKHILSEVDESQRNDVSSVSIKQQMKKEAEDSESSRETPRFSVCLEQDEHHALLSFLSSRDHQPEFLLLYRAYPEFLISHFEGHTWWRGDSGVFRCSPRTGTEAACLVGAESNLFSSRTALCREDQSSLRLGFIMRKPWMYPGTVSQTCFCSLPFTPTWHSST